MWIWESTPDNDFECVSVLHGHTQDVKNVRWHPHEPMLLSCSYDNSIRVWAEDEDDYICVQTLAEHSSTVWDVTFSPEGDYFASCSDDGDVRVWFNRGSGPSCVYRDARALQ